MGKNIQLAVMDMRKAFEKSTGKNAPGAAILYDKFHVMRHLGEALDKVRKREYAQRCLSLKGILWSVMELSESSDERNGKHPGNS